MPGRAGGRDRAARATRAAAAAGRGPAGTGVLCRMHSTVQGA